MRVFSFIEKKIYKTTSEEDCVSKTTKRSTRQQISYSVFTLDMTLSLYSSEGFIHRPKKKFIEVEKIYRSECLYKRVFIFRPLNFVKLIFSLNLMAER